ncbi:hypothetical protein [Rummeliibacillus sp. BSL5]
MFNKNSAMVIFWVGLVGVGTYKLEQVPKLSNLKEVVTQVIEGTAVEQ